MVCGKVVRNVLRGMFTDPIHSIRLQLNRRFIFALCNVIDIPRTALAVLNGVSAFSVKPPHLNPRLVALFGSKNARQHYEGYKEFVLLRTAP